MNNPDPNALPETISKAQVDRLLARIQRLQQQTGGSQGNYEQLRQHYESQANQEIKQQQILARQRRIATLLAEADINPKWRFSEIDATDPSMLGPMQTAHAFINGFAHWQQMGGGCILIHGDYGTGKSTLAGSIAHELIEQHQRSVIFQQWTSIIDHAYFSNYNNAEQRGLYRTALEQVDLLIIDEIAVNRSRLQENQANFLGHLLRRRNNLGKSVILITNHHPDGLPQALGDYCYEAIKGFNPVSIPMYGPSRRPDVV